MAENKIKGREEVSAIAKGLKQQGKVVGFTNGCFDILHKGHVRYLSRAKKLCDVLILGLNSDVSVKRLKGETRPVNTENDRAEVLEALEMPDYITIFDEDTPEELIKSILPDKLFKGGDWREDQVAGGKHVKANGGEVIIIPFVEGYSTTGIIEEMKKRGLKG